MRNVFAATAFSLVLGASVLSPALAQMGGQSGHRMGMMGGRCATMDMMGHGTMGRSDRGGGMMGNPSRMDAMVAGRLAYLKSELNITEAQTEAWDGYANAVNGRVDTMNGMRQSMMTTMQNGSAVERMDARIAGMEAMLESMKAVSPATKSLYTVLTDEQRKIADLLIGTDCGAM